jgi:hypothetical protein
MMIGHKITMQKIAKKETKKKASNRMRNGEQP